MLGANVIEDRLNSLINLVASIGVIADLIFVGYEIRQNTLATEREIRVSFADNVHGKIADSDYLTEIAAKIMEAQGTDQVYAVYSSEFNLSPIEAQ